MEPVLVLVDFSDVTPVLLKTAAELARSLARQLIILHVAIPAPNEAEDDVEGSEDVMSRAGPIHPLQTSPTLSASRRRLQIIELELNRLGVATTTLLLSPASDVRQRPAVQILEQVDRLKPAFVVIGSHDHGRLHQLLVGGVTQAVLRGARRPVVVVPAGMSQVEKS
jgi:nucleotide-binding universal stress UspA family protein